jgi:FtsP/CotA-like multicopper oxidase with cupredoxin domain
MPGPALPLREGREINIDIRNETDVEDIIHWHGLYLPPRSDDAMEEGFADSARGRYATLHVRAETAGNAHSQDMAKTDLTRSLYSGMYGFLIVDPAADPARYDPEFCLRFTTGQAPG